MLKRTFFYSILISAAVAGCTKSDPLAGSEKVLASVSLTNANASAKTVDFFIDGVKKNPNATVGPNATVFGTYVGINADPAHGLTVKDATTGVEYIASTFAGEIGTAYSLFVYDTLTAGKFKTLLVTANRVIAKNDFNDARIRFLNFSPKSPALDFWAVRLVGAVRADSVKVGTTSPYIGSVAVPDLTVLSAYTTVKGNQLAGAIATGSAATTYSLKVVLANTQTLVTSAGTTLVPGRNYTFYARGIYPSTALSVLTDN